MLKVSHHGSDDAGLGALLAESEPELAVISVGADNPVGHPSPATLGTLAQAHVPVLRTDLHGDVEIEVGGGRVVGGGRLIRPSRALLCRGPGGGPLMSRSLQGGHSKDGSNRHPTAAAPTATGGRQRGNGRLG